MRPRWPLTWPAWPPNASSINGVPLAWPAAPHFWRKDGLLALAVSNDQGLVDLVGRVLGPAFAGR